MYVAHFCLFAIQCTYLFANLVSLCCGERKCIADSAVQAYKAYIISEGTVHVANEETISGLIVQLALIYV